MLGSFIIFPFMHEGDGGMMGEFWHMMVINYEMPGGFFSPYGFMGGYSIIGIISGILVIIGAIMLDTHPTDHITWGIVILVFSAISFFGMGGFFIGAILSIVGGALAISWRPTKTVT